MATTITVTLGKAYTVGLPAMRLSAGNGASLAGIGLPCQGKIGSSSFTATALFGDTLQIAPFTSFSAASFPANTSITFSVASSGGGSPGGTSGELQTNNGAGGFGGVPAMNGDATFNTTTGAIAVAKAGGVPILGQIFTFGLAPGTNLGAGTNLFGTSVAVQAKTLTGYSIYLGTNPSGAGGGATIDILKNGSSILSAPVAVAANVTTVTTGVPSTTSVAAGDLITVNTSSVGTGVQNVKIETLLMPLTTYSTPPQYPEFLTRPRRSRAPLLSYISVNANGALSDVRNWVPKMNSGTTYGGSFGPAPYTVANQFPCNASGDGLYANDYVVRSPPSGRAMSFPYSAAVGSAGAHPYATLFCVFKAKRIYGDAMSAFRGVGAICSIDGIAGRFNARCRPCVYV